MDINTSKERIKEGVRLMEEGYYMICDEYDCFNMMDHPLPVDYDNLAELIEYCRNPKTDTVDFQPYYYKWLKGE